LNALGTDFLTGNDVVCTNGKRRRLLSTFRWRNFIRSNPLTLIVVDFRSDDEMLLARPMRSKVGDNL